MDNPKSLMARIGESWKSAFRDVSLIVVSIIIAFTLDAGWSGIQEEQRVSRHFDALEHEFKEALAGFQADKATIENAIRATRAMLAVMGTRQAPAFADSVTFLLNASYDVGIFAYEGGALSAILSSGDIRLIDDDSLSYLLAGWPARLGHLNADNQILTASREQELRPRLIALGIPEARIASNLEHLNLQPTKFPFDTNRILGDAGVESMLVSRLIRLILVLDGVEKASKDAEQVVSRLARAR
jgi:hypothetical protein